MNDRSQEHETGDKTRYSIKECLHILYKLLKMLSVTRQEHLSDVICFYSNSRSQNSGFVILSPTMGSLKVWEFLILKIICGIILRCQ